MWRPLPRPPRIPDTCYRWYTRILRETRACLLSHSHTHTHSGRDGERNMLAEDDREKEKERERESKNTLHALENPETREMERGTNCVTGKK